jgi:hypothetical protein
LAGLEKTYPCHLDPDLDPTALTRLPDWRGAFGQVRAAQGHLNRQGVERGDLFLFWGLFRPVEFRIRWNYVGKLEHRIFGWLQIDDMLPIGDKPQGALSRYPWLADHPHVQPYPWPPTNTIYIASERLQLYGRTLDLPGYGMFKRGLRLTAANSTPSKWAVPDWLNPHRGGVGLSRTREWRWKPEGFLTIGPGQEFVAHVSGRNDALAWLESLFSSQIDSNEHARLEPIQ